MSGGVNGLSGEGPRIQNLAEEVYALLDKRCEENTSATARSSSELVAIVAGSGEEVSAVAVTFQGSSVNDASATTDAGDAYNVQNSLDGCARTLVFTAYKGRPRLTLPAVNSSSDNVDLSMGVMPRPQQRLTKSNDGIHDLLLIHPRRNTQKFLDLDGSARTRVTTCKKRPGLTLPLPPGYSDLSMGVGPRRQQRSEKPRGSRIYKLLLPRSRRAAPENSSVAANSLKKHSSAGMQNNNSVVKKKKMQKTSAKRVANANDGFKCFSPGCTKICKRRSGLAQHQKAIHGVFFTEIVFPCSIEECCLIFSTFWELCDHVKATHPTEIENVQKRKYYCPNCSEVLPVSSSVGLPGQVAYCNHRCPYLAL